MLFRNTNSRTGSMGAFSACPSCRAVAGGSALTALALLLSLLRPQAALANMLPDVAAPDISLAEMEDTSVGKAESVARNHISPESEEDHEFSYGAEVEVNSSYVWRGIKLTSKPMFQPSAWISDYGFTLLVEDNTVMESAPERPHLHSTDLTFSYVGVWDKLRIEPGIAGYLNRPGNGERDPKTGEALLNISYPVGPLRAFVQNAYDIIAYPGAYFGEAGLSYKHNLRRKTQFEVSLHTGFASSRFNLEYIGVDKGALNYVGLDVAATFHPKSYLYIRPHFELSDVVDSTLRANLPWPAAFNGGLAVGLDF